MAIFSDAGRFENTEEKFFDGDIIITDPCYIINDNSCEDDWDKCGYGSNMEALGIHTYLTHDTIVGDWSCTTYDSDAKAVLGNFCADAGLVSVFLLDEVLRYNPDFDYHISRAWTTTLIKNFRGMVQIKVETESGAYDEDTDFWKAGDTWEYTAAYVEGHGINTETGKEINFITTEYGV